MARADDFLNLLAVFLESAGVTAVKTGKQPAKPVNCTTLLGLQGPTVQAQRDVPELQFPRFQALIRNSSYEDASDEHQLVRETLHGLAPGTLLPVGVNTATQPYVRVLRCHADQEGGPIGQHPDGGYEFSINFTAEIHHVTTE